jgi:hypothetical protein
LNTCILYCKTVPGDSNWRYTAKYCTTVELLWICTGFSTRSFNTALIQFIWLLLLANTRHNSTHPNALHTSTEKTVAGYYKPAWCLYSNAVNNSKNSTMAPALESMQLLIRRSNSRRSTGQSQSSTPSTRWPKRRSN